MTRKIDLYQQQFYDKDLNVGVSVEGMTVRVVGSREDVTEFSKTYCRDCDCEVFAVDADEVRSGNPATIVCRPMTMMVANKHCAGNL